MSVIALHYSRMDELHFNIIVSVITGNSNECQQLEYERLIKENEKFRELYFYFYQIYQKPKPVNNYTFNAKEAFEKMKQTLSK